MVRGRTALSAWRTAVSAALLSGARPRPYLAGRSGPGRVGCTCAGCPNLVPCAAAG